FFFQAEDGIRDLTVTGVQTCALPIYLGHDLGVIRLEQLWPGVADDLDIGRELLEVVDELSRRIAAIGIVRRTRRPFFQSLGFGEDRKSVVKGKSVGLGGGRILKSKNK